MNPANKIYRQSIFILLIHLLSCVILMAQDKETAYWHNIPRTLHYKPNGEDFITVNGSRRFTRALYGTNTAFRVEAGDLPEFALYMPGMGGNMKFGLINNEESKWLINAEKITARYRAGSMLYDIEDPMLGNGKLHLTVLALADAEGLIVKVSYENLPEKIKLFWAFGGASGKKFSRDGDIGPDPESSFYLKPEYCLDNSYRIEKNIFVLKYGTGLAPVPDPYINKTDQKDSVPPVRPGKEQTLMGVVPPGTTLHLADANEQSSLIAFSRSSNKGSPALTGLITLNGKEERYFLIQKPIDTAQPSYERLPEIFKEAENVRVKKAGQIKLVTPDAYINTLGAALSIAADAIWESPTYLHGAIGWRMRLNGWRGAYVADVLGWHERAHSHFKAYSLSQVAEPLSGPVVADTALHLARSLEKMGTAVFSNGYISRNPGGELRPHHYDMNLVFVDQLLWHFRWTGDTAFLKDMWPLIKRHLAWEKRNFDADDDGLYDAYASIWASDALQYSGGSVMHSSSYNYRANKMAAELALLMGEDALPYQQEADKIISAINKILWMPNEGSFAEYKDALGLKKLHPYAALWTIYHAIDSDVPNAFQSWQSLRYVDHNIPHIPVKASDLEQGYYTLSTSNWMPYDWSLNNVATAEVMHIALANWQAGRNEEAFKLWKSELISTMYLGGSPGNIGQISFYDAARGEAYRDFADPVGMTARSLIQGLFGITPDLLKDKLTIRPGFPASWDHASLQTPDIDFSFKRKGNLDRYEITPKLSKMINLELMLNARATGIEGAWINGKKTDWNNPDSAVANPLIQLNARKAKTYTIVIQWKNEKIDTPNLKKWYMKDDRLLVSFPQATIMELYDPQKILSNVFIKLNTLQATVAGEPGYRTAFIKMKQGGVLFWQPLDIIIKPGLELIVSPAKEKNIQHFVIDNNSGNLIELAIKVNDVQIADIGILAGTHSHEIKIDADKLVPGSNRIICVKKGTDQVLLNEKIINWAVDTKNQHYEEVILDTYFNDRVTQIFKNNYLSPRPITSTLQLPIQGIGDWTHPLKTAEINDKGLRTLAGARNRIVLPQGIFFRTPSDSTTRNIVFTSQWDNYPRQISVPLSGKASHAYFLMAGSTNPMQTRITNGTIQILYADGSTELLELKNPQSWWPIDQDYFDDGYAFHIDAPRPVRVHLKTGKIVSDYDDSIKDYNGKMIEGGAATVLDIPLDKNKTLKSLILKTVSNDVVIGLMAVTLSR